MEMRKPGRHRVEAWIYGVINPLAQALERERSLAGLKIPTYSRRSAGLERFNLIRGYLSRGAGLIFDDLVRAERRLVRIEKAHDTDIMALADSADAAFQALQRDPEFTRFATRAFSKVADDRATAHLDVAEDLVNDKARKLNARPGSYDAAWNQHLARLKSMRPKAEFAVLDRNLTKALEGSQKALDFLDALRRRLVESHDVPPAPLDR